MLEIRSNIPKFTTILTANYVTNFQDGGNGLEFAMIEHWRDQASIDAHMKTAHVKEYLDKYNNGGLKEKVTVVIDTYKSCGI